MAGSSKTNLEATYGTELSGIISSQWGEDVNVTVDDKLHKSYTGNQTLSGKVIFQVPDTDSHEVIKISPNTYMEGIDAIWRGFNIDGNLLDPQDTGIELTGYGVNLTGVVQTNNPDMNGIKAELPTSYGSGDVNAGYFSGDGGVVRICTGNYAFHVDVGNIKFDGTVYFSNGTTYYMDTSGDMKVNQLVSVNTCTFQNTVYFANGTTYKVEADGDGMFKDVHTQRIYHILDTDQYINFITSNAMIELAAGVAAGDKKFKVFGGSSTGHPYILPDTDGEGSCGEALTHWGVGYINEIHGEDLYIDTIYSSNESDIFIDMNYSVGYVKIKPGTDSGNPFVEFFSSGTSADTWNPVIVPSGNEQGRIGTSGKKWSQMWAEEMFDTDGTLGIYDEHDDLAIIESMGVWKKNGKIQRDRNGIPLIARDTIPDFLKGPPAESGPDKGKRRSVRASLMAAFSWGAIKQLNRKVDNNDSETVNILATMADKLDSIENRLEALENKK